MWFLPSPKAWNTCVKLTHGVPRSTHTYIVENYLATGFISVRNQIYSRFVKFVKTLESSASSEVRHVFGIVNKNIHSTTGSNLYRIQADTGLRPSSVTAATVRSRTTLVPIPEQDLWRLPLLDKFLCRRAELELLLEDTERPLQQLIDSLCDTWFSA